MREQSTGIPLAQTVQQPAQGRTFWCKYIRRNQRCRLRVMAFKQFFLDSACVEPVNSVVCVVDCGLRYWCIVRYSLIQKLSGIRGVRCRVAASWSRCSCCSFSGGLTYNFAVMQALECQAGKVGLCTAHQYGLMTMHVMMRCGMLDAASDSGQHNRTGSLGVTHPILAFVQVSIGLAAVASLHNSTQWVHPRHSLCMHAHLACSTSFCSSDRASHWNRVR